MPPLADEERADGALPRTYAQEQHELKKAFLTAFDETEAGEGADGEGGFASGVLKQRARKAKAAAAAEQAAEGAGEGGEAGARGGAVADAPADPEARVQQLLDGYFGRDEQLSKEDRFLKRYILNKVWAGMNLSVLLSHGNRAAALRRRAWHGRSPGRGPAQ